MAELAPIADSTLELISFEIAEQEFCIDIRNVREIRGWAPATPVPQTPSYIQGVINLRGAVIPVVDLRNRLGLGETVPSSRHVILVIQDGERVAGLLVDGVHATFRVDGALMQPPPPLESLVSDRFVDAILPLDGRLLSRLVVSTLFPNLTLQAA